MPDGSRATKALVFQVPLFRLVVQVNMEERIGQLRNTEQISKNCLQACCDVTYNDKRDEPSTKIVENQAPKPTQATIALISTVVL